MRRHWIRAILALSAMLVTLSCQRDQIFEPGEATPRHPEIEALALRVVVDVAGGTVRVLPSQGTARDSGGPSLAILGGNEVGVTTGNLVRSAPVNGKVTVTFDAALTNRLTSASLVPSTWPSGTGGTGLVLFPFQVTQAVGGSASQVAASTDWNGDGSAGSGALRNFFNDVGCPSASALADCFRWEQYPAPLGPGETTAAQKVGFTLPKAITSFQVLMVLTADISNDLPAVAAIGVTPASYVMNDGFAATFTAVAYDAQNHPLSWPTLTWTTADHTALQFQNGSALVGVRTGPSQIVHGRKVGQTSFTVSSGGISVVVPVDIQVNTVALVQLYTPDSSLTVGDQVQGDVRVKDHSGQIIPGFQPTWSTTDPNVITVDQNGLITAVGPGTADVVATAGLASGRVTITVGAAPVGSLSGTVNLFLEYPPRPASGVKLDAVRGGVTFTTATDAAGGYSFPSLPVGQYLVFVQHELCTLPPGSGLPVTVTQTATLFDFVINCPPVVEGRVVEVFGNPLPIGLNVYFSSQSSNWGRSSGTALVQSNGSYQTTLPAGSCDFQCSPVDVILFAVGPSCVIQSGPSSIPFVHALTLYTLPDFTLDCRPRGAITGTAVDLEGQPVSGVQVDARNQTTGENYSTTTDAAGTYSLDLLPAADYGITAQKPGFCQSSSAVFSVPAGPPTTVPFAMDCPALVQGTAIEPYGNPQPTGMSVEISSSFQTQTRTLAVSPGGNYSSRLYGLWTSAFGYDLTLQGVPHPRCSTNSWGTTSLHQQVTYQFDFSLDCRPSTVTVVVNDGGSNPGNPQPLIGASVTLTPQNPPAVLTDGQGRASFVLPGTDGTTAQVNPVPAGCTNGYNYQTSGVTPVRGSVTTVIVAVNCTLTGALEGTITTALGNPLGNVTVIVGSHALITNQSGHWGVAGLPAGLLIVNILPPLPAGCTAPGPLQPAVIPGFTITVNQTVTCNGF